MTVIHESPSGTPVEVPSVGADLYCVSVTHDWGTVDSEKNDALILVDIPEGYIGIPSIVSAVPFGSFATCSPMAANIGPPIPFTIQGRGINAAVNNVTGAPLLVGVITYEVLILKPSALRKP